MTHGFDAASAGAVPRDAVTAPAMPGVIGIFSRALRSINALVMMCGGVALVCACLVLSYSVIVRYVYKLPTDWQDETAVFLIIGSTFLSSGAVQAKRGHVAIEALTGLLSPRINRGRLIAVDIVSLGFVTFLAWKSFALLHEAWVDGQVSSSSWGPPLWIPYTLMAGGLSLLAVQLLLQILEAVAYGPGAAGWDHPKIGLAADGQGRPVPDRH